MNNRKRRANVMEMIFEEMPYLREYARQRSLVGPNLKRRRVVKAMRKVESINLKQLSKDSKLNASHENLQKMIQKVYGGEKKFGLVDKDGAKQFESAENDDMRALAYQDDLPPELVEADFITRGSRPLVR